MSFVYLIQAEYGGPVKIGHGGFAERRLAHFQLGCPIPLRLLRVIEGDAADEAWLHQRFASDRLHGEWFRPSDELLAFARSSEPVGATPFSVRHARLDAGLSQAELAEAVSLSHSIIQRLERSDPRRMDVRRLHLIAVATGKPLSFFLGKVAA